MDSYKRFNVIRKAVLAINVVASIALIVAIAIVR